ncbi:FIST N-terminal domain-containing protein [Candidatus Altiarchaeota archaeon]
MKLDTLVISKAELDSSRIIEYIRSVHDAGLVLCFSCIDDKFSNLDLFKNLIENVDPPFLGVRVVGFAIESGYYEDSILVCVFSGNFNASVGSLKIDYDNPDKTAGLFSEKISSEKLMLVYSSNHPKRDSWVNSILKQVQNSNPDIQIAGGVSGNPPFIATKEGIYADHIAYVLLDQTDFSFILDSGFELMEETPSYTVTHSNDYYMLKIDGEPASLQYSKIQHIQPYFLNMLSNLFAKSNFTKLMKRLSQTSDVMYEGVMKFVVTLLGREIAPGKAEILACFELDDESLLAQSSFPPGTTLKRIKTTPEDQLAVFERLDDKSTDSGVLLINACLMCAYWMDFKFDKLVEKISKLDKPTIVIFLWGEFGTEVPYIEDKNLLHGGTVKTVLLK